MKLTRHMVGILFILHDAGSIRPIGLVAHALIRLANDGYVRVGRKASLTAKGRRLVTSGILARPDVIWREDCSNS
jgi:hypothetical protein